MSETIIHKYIRDDKEIHEEEWRRLLKQDIYEEEVVYNWEISNYVNTDIGEGREVEVNDHSYQIKTDTVYESAKELFADLMFEGKQEDILSVLDNLPESDLFRILSMVENVTAKDGKLILEE